MLIQQMKDRVDVLFNKLIANKLVAKRKFVSDVLKQIRDKIKADADKLKTNLEAMFSDGQEVDLALDFIRDYLIGHIKLSWFARLFVNPDDIVREVFSYLKLNKSQFASAIGELNPA